MLVLVLSSIAVSPVGASSASTGSPTCPAPTAATKATEASVIALGNVPGQHRTARPAPPGKVRAPSTALVSCVGASAIAGATFNHWALVAERTEGGRAEPRTIIGEVMGFLISADWVVGEAAALGINPTPTQVVHRFESVRRQQFPRRGEFAHFIRSSGQTVADLEFRVRLNMDSRAIQEHVAAGAHTQAEREQAIANFVKAFKSKWKPQTYCAARYAVDDCGHVGTL